MNKTAYDMCYFDSMIQKNRYLIQADCPEYG